MFACSFVGAMVGELFHVRVMKDKNAGIGLTFFITLLAVCRNGVFADFAILKYILWMIPPISDVVSWFTDANYYDMGDVMKGTVLLLVYGIVLGVGEVELLRREKF